MKKCSLNSRKSTVLNTVVAVLTITSIILVFIAYLYPLAHETRISIYLFDLFVTGTLVADFLNRLKTAEKKIHFILTHWYEFPAMIPIILYNQIDSIYLIQTTLGTIRFLVLFRLVRLYNIALMIKGSEILLLSSIGAVTIIFGGFGIYVVESGNPQANIQSINDGLWWATETITTVAYGEYYPITFLGKVISTILMFSAIGIIWTVVAMITTKLLEKKNKSNVSIMQDTKNMIKNKIDEIESLDKQDLDELINLLKMLNNNGQKNGTV